MRVNLTVLKRGAAVVVGVFSFLCAAAQSPANAPVAQASVPAIDSTATVQSTGSYDPIAAVLDSLVTLNYVQRLNFASVGTQQNNFQPYEIPVYSDEEYGKRVCKIQSPIPLVYNQQVREYIDLYAVRKRALTERVMGLAQLYFPLYEQVLDQNNLPLEFKYLSIVESALNATAVSRAGATGLWQFMLHTGQLYKLKVTSYIDERRDPAKATQAACEYFKNMYDIYHDWLLVIAAYNCGAGNINKAIARYEIKLKKTGNVQNGQPTFWQISNYLPRETRGYVPAFIAVTYLMNNAKEHNLVAIPPVISFHEADTVLVEKKVSLRDVASVIDVPYELITYLNPVYKRGVIPDLDDPQVLRLPVNKVHTYLANVDKLFPAGDDPSFAMDKGSGNPMEYVTKLVKQIHIVKRGERMASIADEYDCTVSDIKHWNKIKSSKVFKGQRLVVYVPTKQKIETHAVVTPVHSDSANTAATKVDTAKKENVAQNNPASSDSDQSSKFVWHIVQPGDTLWNIAQRYNGVTVEEIKAINNLSSNELKPGTRLKVKVNG